MNQTNISGHTGLRGIAVLVVLLGHLQLHVFFPEPLKESYRFFLWHNEAVDMFFMLSGFVLCHVYGFEPLMKWRSYAAARFGRIYPLAFVTMIFCIVLDGYSYLRHGMQSANLGGLRIINNLFLLNGLYGDVGRNSINVPSWSISVEAFLYVAMFPMLLRVSKRFNASKASYWLAAGLLSIMLLMGCPHPESLQPFPWSFIPCFPFNWSFLLRGIFGFSAGFCICQMLRKTLVQDPQLMSKLGLLSICGICLVLLFSLPRNLLMPLFFVLVYCSALNDTLLSLILSTPVINYLGERSYSIYLIHLPILILFQRLLINSARNGHTPGAYYTTAFVAALTTFLLAELSYRFFEIPMRSVIRKKLSQAQF